MSDEVPTTMSLAPRDLRDRIAPTTTDGVDASTALDTARRTAFAPVQFVGFWMAVTLPFCYLPLLYGGLPAQEARAFLALLCINLVALVIGRGYARE
jgi:hypothetical protein